MSLFKISSIKIPPFECFGYNSRKARRAFARYFLTTVSQIVHIYSKKEQQSDKFAPNKNNFFPSIVVSRESKKMKEHIEKWAFLVFVLAAVIYFRPRRRVQLEWCNLTMPSSVKWSSYCGMFTSLFTNNPKWWLRISTLCYCQRFCLI